MCCTLIIVNLCRSELTISTRSIAQALDRTDLPLRARKDCLRSMYRTCGRHGLLPTTLKILISYDQTSDPLYRGGFADVWKGEYRGRDVAVKILRTHSNADLQKIIGVSCWLCSLLRVWALKVLAQRFCKEVVTWKSLQHPNILPLIGVTMSKTKFAMVSDWMVNGNINDFVRARPDANRLQLVGFGSKSRCLRFKFIDYRITSPAGRRH